MVKVMILVAYNTQLDLTKEFLDTILSFKNECEVELILVNGGNPVGIEHPVVKYRIDLTESGFAKVFNAGLNHIIKHEEYDYVLMLGNDSFPLSDYWLDELIKIQQSTSAMCVCPSTTRPPMHNYSHLLINYSNGLWDVNFFPSIVYLLTKECIEKVGVWDEGFIRTGMYGDNDYCTRIKNHNGKIIVSENIIMEHRLSLESGSTGTVGEDMNINSEYYRKKWGV